MAKIKEVEVSVSLSYDYNSVRCGEIITLEDGDSPIQEKKNAFLRCKSECIAQINKLKKRKENIEKKKKKK